MTVEELCRRRCYCRSCDAAGYTFVHVSGVETERFTCVRCSGTGIDPEAKRELEALLAAERVDSFNEAATEAERWGHLACAGQLRKMGRKPKRATGGTNG